MIRSVIIGLGRVASELEDDPLREKPCTHAGAITAHPECTLVGGYDLDRQKSAQFKARWQAQTDYRSARECIVSTRPHMVVVATHPDSHLNLVQLAAHHHVPLIICEKPLADTLRNSRAIMKIHRKGVSTILVNHERRYANNWRWLREVIQQQHYGTLLSVRSTLYFGATRTKKETLIHDGTHLIDILAFILGRTLVLNRVVGSMHTRKSSTYVCMKAVATSVPGIPCILEIGSERDYHLFEVECSFRAGRIIIGNGYWRAERSIHSPYYQGFNSLDQSPFQPQKTTGYFAGMIEDAVQCIQKGSTPLSSALDAYRVMQLITKINRH